MRRKRAKIRGASQEGNRRGRGRMPAPLLGSSPICALVVGNGTSLHFSPDWSAAVSKTSRSTPGVRYGPGFAHRQPVNQSIER